MINLDYYKGIDFYSDGEIEDEILKIFEDGQDVDEVLKKDNRWPILYHLSPQRTYLLEWFPFEPNQNLLEIGAGCGALTGLFCEKLKKVTAVELSKKRSQINQARNSKYSNLEIMVSNINDVVIKEQFDYVTLIGVLEYTKSFIHTEDPYKELFDKIKKWLKPNGKLIVAIENRFGLKYWAGAKEDHTGKLFDGIEGYRENNKIETFSKQELSDLLINNGFNDIDFYYPYPDYKLPNLIYSDQYLPDINDCLAPSENYDLERMAFLDESNVMSALIKNRMFDFFSNSYLVFTGVGEKQ